MTPAAAPEAPPPLKTHTFGILGHVHTGKLFFSRGRARRESPRTWTLAEREVPAANTPDPLYNSPLGKLPDGVMGRVVANLDRQSAINLAEANDSWNKPLKTLGCGFDQAEAPSECQKDVDYDPDTINHALLCAVHKSNECVEPARYARFDCGSGFPLDVTLNRGKTCAHSRPRPRNQQS